LSETGQAKENSARPSGAITALGRLSGDTDRNARNRIRNALKTHSDHCSAKKSQKKTRRRAGNWFARVRTLIRRHHRTSDELVAWQCWTVFAQLALILRERRSDFVPERTSLSVCLSPFAYNPISLSGFSCWKTPHFPFWLSASLSNWGGLFLPSSFLSGYTVCRNCLHSFQKISR
jgi:hypothetical protein